MSDELGPHDSSQCAKTFFIGSIITMCLALFLLYILVAYILRAILGEKVHRDAAFWFYLSMAAYVPLFLPFFLQAGENGFCHMVCYSYFLLHCAMRTSTVAFVFNKLDLIKPSRVAQGNIFSKSLLEGICMIIVCIYISVMVFRWIARFFTGCYDIDYVGGCMAERTPIIYFHNIPEAAMTCCEAFLLFRLIKMSRVLYSEHNFQVENMWFEKEVVARMWWYVLTSFMTLSTNMVLYFGLTIFKSFGGFRFGVDYCHWAFFLNVHIINMVINTVAITCCFRLRSLNVYYLISAIYFKGENTLPALQEPSTEYTPEQLREFKELEMMKVRVKLKQQKRQTPENTKRKIESKNRRIKLKPGLRTIQRNWEKDPFTGEIKYLPTPSPSPSETDDEESSSGVLLHIPGVKNLPKVDDKPRRTPSESAFTGTSSRFDTPTCDSEDPSFLREIKDLAGSENMLVGGGLFHGSPENPLAE